MKSYRKRGKSKRNSTMSKLLEPSNAFLLELLKCGRGQQSVGIYLNFNSFTKYSIVLAVTFDPIRQTYVLIFLDVLAFVNAPCSEGVSDENLVQIVFQDLLKKCNFSK